VLIHVGDSEMGRFEAAAAEQVACVEAEDDGLCETTVIAGTDENHQLGWTAGGHRDIGEAIPVEISHCQTSLVIRQRERLVLPAVCHGRSTRRGSIQDLEKKLAGNFTGPRWLYESSPRMWISWACLASLAVCGAATSAHGSENISYELSSALTCPNRDQLYSALDRQLVALPTRAERDWLDRHTLRVSPGLGETLLVELLDSLSRVTFSRSIPKGTCQAQSEAVALLTRSWLAQAIRYPEADVVPPVVTAPVASVRAEPAAAPVVAPLRAGWHPFTELRLGGGALLASTSSPFGGSLEAAVQLFLGQRWGLAAR